MDRRTKTFRVWFHYDDEDAEARAGLIDADSAELALKRAGEMFEEREGSITIDRIEQLGSYLLDERAEEEAESKAEIRRRALKLELENDRMIEARKAKAEALEAENRKLEAPPRPRCPCGEMTIDDCAGECGATAR